MINNISKIVSTTLKQAQYGIDITNKILKVTPKNIEIAINILNEYRNMDQYIERILKYRSIY